MTRTGECALECTDCRVQEMMCVQSNGFGELAVVWCQWRMIRVVDTKLFLVK